MNELSWLLYFADVAPRISSAFAAISILCIIAYLAINWIGNLVNTGENEHPFDIHRSHELYKPIDSRLIFFLLFLFVISKAIPSDKNTYYAIAASEIGEQALKTPVVTKSFKAIETWLDKQLMKETEEQVENADT